MYDQETYPTFEERIAKRESQKNAMIDLLMVELPERFKAFSLDEIKESDWAEWRLIEGRESILVKCRRAGVVDKTGLWVWFLYE